MSPDVFASAAIKALIVVGSVFGMALVGAIWVTVAFYLLSVDRWILMLLWLLGVPFAILTVVFSA